MPGSLLFLRSDHALLSALQRFKNRMERILDQG